MTGSWVWIAIAVGAALAQTARNAAQRSLIARAGTLGATLSRFVYGLPFAAATVALLQFVPAFRGPMPPLHTSYFAWLALGAAGQLAATAAMLVAMKQRNFVIGAAFSKTDALQVLVFGSIFLGELPGWVTMFAIALATTGVALLSLPARSLTDRSSSPNAIGWGLASGAGFAISAVGYRGAALELPGVPAFVIGAWGVLFAQFLQSLVLGGWLSWRSPGALRELVRERKVALVAGAMGALASLGWFTAFAITTASNVRAVGLVEVAFGYAVSHRLKESFRVRDHLGLLLIGAGLVTLCITATSQ